MYISEEINQLERDELLELLWKYDEYVQTISERNDGSQPVCLMEYYQNDFQEYLESSEERCKHCAYLYGSKDNPMCDHYDKPIKQVHQCTILKGERNDNSI